MVIVFTHPGKRVYLIKCFVINIYMSVHINVSTYIHISYSYIPVAWPKLQSKLSNSNFNYSSRIFQWDEDRLAKINLRAKQQQDRKRRKGEKKEKKRKKVKERKKKETKKEKRKERSCREIVGSNIVTFIRYE